jgi:hypothetical protein
MIDVRLAATNPEDSTLVPVSCNARGELNTVAPKIEEIPNDLKIDGDLTVTGLINGSTGVGEPGPPGPEGPEGPAGSIELPPGATDGALLGWQDGELVWITEPVPPTNTGFRAIIYNGNSGLQTISGLGFSPDLVWAKSRSYSTDHYLFDAVRGATKDLKSNTTSGEGSNSGLIQFNSDGYDIGSDSSMNTSGRTYVNWCWAAGDTTVTNNDGSIESQVRSNGGFSVVKYTTPSSGGPWTVGHQLSNTPDFIITKGLFGSSWIVYHSSVGNTKYLELNTSQELIPEIQTWNNTSPSNTVFTQGTTTWWGANSAYIAYCWAETPGVSSFGRYDSTGSRLSISTGFRPSLVIIRSLETGNWFMFDNARGASNALYANLNEKEAETGAIEFQDNGFQLLFALPGVNENNVTYIYAAFANPEDALAARRQLRQQERRERRQQNETRPR